MNMEYHPTKEILRLIANISTQLGGIIPVQKENIPPAIKKQRRIDTIHATMQLEGKFLSRELTEAATEGIAVRGPRIRLQEVSNLVKVYDSLSNINPFAQSSILEVHKTMTKGLEEESGQYRNMDAGIFRGAKFIGLAPAPGEVPGIMNDLFDFLNDKDENILIKACMAHYMLETTQPFMDNGGMMGRLWQTLLLFNQYPIVEFLPYEKILLQNKKEYHKAFSDSHTAGDPTEFIAYMLMAIWLLLKEIGKTGKYSAEASDRILYFHKLGMQSFTRKDYMKVIRNISPATASRDLEKGVNAGLFEMRGFRNTTTYSCQKP